jgi:hypothetical protein
MEYDVTISAPVATAVAMAPTPQVWTTEAEVWWATVDPMASLGVEGALAPPPRRIAPHLAYDLHVEIYTRGPGEQLRLGLAWDGLDYLPSMVLADNDEDLWRGFDEDLG